MGEEAAPSDHLKAALESLCAPSWEIHHVYGNSRFSLDSHLYAGGDSSEALWVNYRSKNENHILSFPHHPKTIVQVMKEGLQTKRVPLARQIVHQLSMAEFSMLLVLADFSAQKGGKLPNEFSYNELIDWMRQQTSSESGLLWLSIAARVSPVPLPHIQDVLETGLRQLCEEAFLRQEGETWIPDPRLKSIVKSLETPKAYSALRVGHRTPEDKLINEGFTVVRTKRSLWVWEPARDLTTEDSVLEAPIQLFQVTGEKLLKITNHFLGIEEP